MSAVTTIFYQECPTCGRSVRIPVKYFGRSIACSHCSGEFVADPSAPKPAATASRSQLIPRPNFDLAVAAANSPLSERHAG